FQMVFGAMSDRRDPTRFLPLGIVVLGLGSALVSLSSTFWMLLLLVSLSRIGASFYHPVGIAWIGREFQGLELDRSMGFQSAFGATRVLLHGFGFAHTAAEIAIAIWILAGALVAFFFGRVSRRFGRLRTLTACYAFIGFASLIGVASGSAAVVLGLFWTLGSAVFITY